eukprot:4936778-Pleurochrysis_carterae.AAC.1
MAKIPAVAEVMRKVRLRPLSAPLIACCFFLRSDIHLHATVNHDNINLPPHLSLISGVTHPWCLLGAYSLASNQAA